MTGFSFNPRNHKDIRLSSLPNLWDGLAFSLIVMVLFLLSQTMTGQALNPIDAATFDVSLDYNQLPYYALRSFFRMFMALFFSLIVAIALGTLAARSARAERYIIPLVDILQSLPILGYLALAASLFSHNMPNQRLGLEMVAIFAIFTSQVWNMILSFYQSLKILPTSMQEASAMMNLSHTLKFWRVDVPFAMPDLLMNTMISLSAGWFYVVESEAINSGQLLLPGLGSYIWKANQAGDSQALTAAVVAMFVVILCYDQLIFRPLSHLVHIYQAQDDEPIERSWVFNLILKTHWLRLFLNTCKQTINTMLERIGDWSKRYQVPYDESPRYNQGIEQWLALVLSLIFISICIHYILNQISINQFLWILFYGFCTAIRVFSVVFFAICLWLPIGVWIGFRPKLTKWVEPIIQFLAAFPPNILYPLMMEAILYYNLDFNFWCAPLMILGTQWYILVNVITATRNLPKELMYAAKNLQLSTLQQWRYVLLPGVAPNLVSGALAAAGGAWNASIAAEVLSWSGNKIYAVGLGAFIAQHSEQTSLQVIGIAVMCALVVCINRIFWYPLFHYVEKHYALDHL